MKPFSQWTIEEVEDVFHLVSAHENKLFANWLTAGYDISQDQEKQLERLCKKLRARVWDWNEEELKVSFIGLVLDMVDFDQENYRSFMEREISAVHEDENFLNSSLTSDSNPSPPFPTRILYKNRDS